MTMEREEVRREEPREKQLREFRRFDHWNGERKEGEWRRESIHTGVKRKYSVFAKSQSEKNEDGSPKTVKVDVEEDVYIHDGYRPLMAGEKKTRKAFFWRGARVWRDV